MKRVHLHRPGFLLVLLVAGACPQTRASPEPPDAPVGTYPDSPKWVTGYYPGYQQDLYPPEKVDFSALTHLVVGRVLPRADGGVNTNLDIDAEHGPQLARLLSRRAHAAGRKALLLVGGAGEHDGFVGATRASTRPRFVENLVKAMQDLGYDGLDLDWEPLNRADRPSFTALVEDLRAATPGIILTLPIGWLNVNTDLPADRWYAEIAPLFAQLNVMSYSMAGPWGWKSWHSSALKGAGGLTPTSVASSVAGYIRAGVPRAKLGIGIGVYGSCWTAPVTAPRQATLNSTVAASDNEMSYTRIMTLYFDGGARRWDDAAKVPYLSFAKPHGPSACTFISYEDEESIAAKGRWVRANGLGGAILWTVNQGYLPANDRNPPLEAARDASIAPTR